MAIVYRSTLASGGGAAEGTAVQADVRSGKTFSNSTASGLPGTMENITGSTHTLDGSTTSYTIPEGYHDGTGQVKVTTEEKTASSASYNSNTVVNASSGKLMTKATVPPLTHTDTYQATSRSSALNMGENHKYRYVDTTGVPGIVPSGNRALSYSTNGSRTGIDVTDYATVSVDVSVPTGVTPSGTKTITSRSSSIDVESYKYADTTGVPNSHSGTWSSTITSNGTKDLGAEHTFRYVSVNVPSSSHTAYYPSSSSYDYVNAGQSKTIDLGSSHNYRYVRVSSFSSAYSYQETKWTNSSPSSSFSAQTIQTGIEIGGDGEIIILEGYQMVAITYRQSTSSNNYFVDFIQLNTGDVLPWGSLGDTNALVADGYARTFTTGSYTSSGTTYLSLVFQTAKAIGGSGSSAARCVPTKIELWRFDFDD